MKSSLVSLKNVRAWMVTGPDGPELQTVRSTRAEAIDKFCDRAFHVPSAWAEHRKEGYSVVKVRVDLA